MKHKKEFEHSENSRFFPKVLPNIVREKAEVEERTQKLKQLIEEANE